MFLLFTPYSFIYFTIYSLFFILLLSTPNFVIFWSFIELIMLLFMGLSYTLFANSYSFLVVYFLIQTFSSFCILITYLYNINLLFTIALILNLGIFPFHFWFVNVAYRFPNFLLFIISTIHKLPVFIIIPTFSLSLHSSTLWLTVIVSTLVSGILILSINDLRMVLIASSVGNNSWFLISLTLSLSVFFAFFVIYSFILFLTLNKIGSFTNPSFSSQFTISTLIVALSGLPPFPLFFTNIVIMSQLLLSPNYSFLVFLFLIANALVLAGYLQVIMNYFVYSYTNSVSFVSYLGNNAY